MSTLETTIPPDDQVRDLQSLVSDIRGGWAEIRNLPAAFKTLQDESAQSRQQLDDVRHLLASRAPASLSLRSPGSVTDDCAQHLVARLIAHCEKSGRLDTLCSLTSQREALVQFACSTLNIGTRAALTTTDIPLPTQYAGQLRELISEFGVVRRRMSPYPIGLGTARPARMGLRPAFGSIAMSGAFDEKVTKLEFASLESHKLGGIVRLPREIDEQSIVPMGRFLARYGAVEFARAEDSWGFLADGSATYESVKGIVKTARDNDCARVLGTGKITPGDATLEDFRALRRLVNKAALNGRLSAYYLDTTWESALHTFNSADEPTVYQRRSDGSAVLDGYPIVWTDVLQPYGTDDAANKPLAVFGALSFWWMGEHGTPRIDTSEHVWFANDQLAVRFIEEIDFDYCAPDATAALLTAAA